MRNSRDAAGQDAGSSSQDVQRKSLSQSLTPSTTPETSRYPLKPIPYVEIDRYDPLTTKRRRLSPKPTPARSRASSTSSLSSLDLSDDDRPVKRPITIDISLSDDEDDGIVNTALTVPQAANRARRATAKQGEYHFAPKMYRSNRPLRPSPASAAEKAKIVPHEEQKAKARTSIQALLRDKKRKARLGTDLKGIEHLDALAAAQLKQRDEASPEKEEIRSSIHALQNEYWDDLDSDEDEEGEDKDGKGESDRTATDRVETRDGNPLHHVWLEPHPSAASTGTHTPQAATPALDASQMVQTLDSLHVADANGNKHHTDLVASILQADFAKGEAGQGRARSSRFLRKQVRVFEFWRRGRVKDQGARDLEVLLSDRDCSPTFVASIAALRASGSAAGLASHIATLAATKQPEQHRRVALPCATLLSIYGEGDVRRAAREWLRSIVGVLSPASLQVFSGLCRDTFIALGARRDLLALVTPVSNAGQALPSEPEVYGPTGGRDLQEATLDPKRRALVTDNVVQAIKAVLEECTAPRYTDSIVELVQLLHLVACDDASLDPLELSELQILIDRGARCIVSNDEEGETATARSLLAWITHPSLSPQAQFKALQRFPNSTPEMRTARRNLAFDILFARACEAEADAKDAAMTAGPILPRLETALTVLESQDSSVNPLRVPKQGADFDVLEARIGLLSIALSDFALQLCDPATAHGPSTEACTTTPRVQTVIQAFQSTVEPYLFSSTPIEPSPHRRKTLEAILEALGAIQVRLTSCRPRAGDAEDDVQRSQCISALSRFVLASGYILNQARGIRMVAGVECCDDGVRDGGKEVSSKAISKVTTSRPGPRRSDQTTLKHFFTKSLS